VYPEPEKEVSQEKLTLNKASQKPEKEKKMERMSDFSFTDKSVSKTSHVESKTCSNFSKNSTKFEKRKRNLTLEQVFCFEDRSSAYLEEGKYDQAFTLLKKQIELGMQLSYCRQLMTYHTVALMSRNSEQAAKVRSEMAGILKDEIPMQATPENLQKIAHRFKDRKNFPESFLFYKLAADFFYSSDVLNSRGRASGIANCCSGIRNAVKCFHEEGNSPNKETNTRDSLIQHHVVPLMRGMHEMMSLMQGVDDGFKVYCEAHCLHCIEYIEGHIKDFESCEMTLVEAVNLIESNLKDSSKRNRVFATLLHNLGFVYEVTGRLGASLKMYTKAVKADKMAVDYKSENERKANMQAGEFSIKRVKGKQRSERSQEQSNLDDLRIV